MGRFRWLGLVVFAALASVALPSIARADHFRGGYITWKRLTADTVEFRSVQVWRSDEVTPLEINPGDGDVTIIGPVGTIFTGTDLVGDSYTVISYKVTHTYATAGPFTAFLGIGTNSVTCCRIVDLVNVSLEGQQIETEVDLSNTGSPVPAIPMLIQVVNNCPNSVPLPASDVDGVSCSLAGDVQAGTNPGDIAIGTFPNDLTVSSGCVLSWKPAGTFVGAKYAAQILLDDGAADGTRVAVDLLIEVKDGQCCGNDLVESGEICDGTADAACPGNCQANCTCCGDGIIEPGAGEVCEVGNDAACNPSPGLGCSGCQCVTPGGGGGGGGCSDSCANDVSICSGISGLQVVDANQLFSTGFLGTDPCDALIVNDLTWGELPGTAFLVPGAQSLQPAPTMGTCSNDGNVTCATCDDCPRVCTHDSNVACTTNFDCASLVSGSTCISGGTCVKPPNQFPVTFNWTPLTSDEAQTFGATVTFTPPGFTVPGGTQYFCDFQIHVRGCGDDVIDQGEECDGVSNAACGGAPCIPPGQPGACQCPVCGDNSVNLPDEDCDGTDDSACPGQCRPSGDPHECTCPTCGDGQVDAPEQCDGAADLACPGKCLPSCVCAFCGDGIIHPGIGERCEVGGNDAACPGNCLPPGDPNECRCRGCGDGDVNQPSEQCDGADAAACPGLCLPSCLCPVCGDGSVNQPSEQCDGADAVACPGACLPAGDPHQCRCPICGDGDVNRPSEQCDGADDSACPGLCQPSCLCPACGDGTINQPSEQCDGADAAACVGECRPAGDPNQCRCPICGDADVNQASEQCDGSDDAACPGRCMANCRCPVCGDGVVSAPNEQCEAGNDAACPGQCRPPGDQNACRCPICGDGDVNQASEQCDGADDAACPGACAATCTCAVCGDGIISAPVEDCDGGNDAACPGQCFPPNDPNACRCPRCGDGIINQPSEECDGAAMGVCATGVCQPDCTYATCGNCTLDAGETCDPPNGEICNNLTDDDGDGKLNCDDTDCTPGRTCKHTSNPAINALVSTLACASSRDCNSLCSHDLTTPCTSNAQCAALAVGSFCIDGAKCVCPDIPPAGFQTCGATCAPAFGCGCIRNDPARIRFATRAGAPDLLKIHGRFLVEEGTMDPPSDGFTLLLVSADGVVYEGSLRAGDLSGRPGRYAFTDVTAKTGAGTRDGLARVSVRIKKVKGQLNYVFKADIYGDFSGAAATMTTQVIAGNATASLSGEWTRSANGWKLTSFE